MAALCSLDMRLGPLACLLVVGCAHAPAQRPAETHTPAVASGPRIDSEDEYTAARADYEPLDTRDAARPGRRAGLESFLLSEIAKASEGGHLEEAFEHLKDLFTLYDAVELRGRVDDPRLLEALSKLQPVFSRRGAHEEVLASLIAEHSLAPDARRAGVEKRYREVAGWMVESADQRAEGRERLIEDLESVARIWPSPFLVKELTALYFDRQKAPSQPGLFNRRQRSGMDIRELIAASGKPTLAYDLATLYLRVSDLNEAVAQLRKLSGQPGDEPEVRQLLEKAAAPNATVSDYLGLMQLLRQPGHDDRDVALRICRDAARRFPDAAEPHLRAGQLALSMATQGQSPKPSMLGVAVSQTEVATRLDAGNAEPWELLAALYQLRLGQIVSDENMKVADLEASLKKVEQFHADAQKKFPSKKLSPSMADALLEVGQGYYNIGRLAEAVTYLDRSLAMQPSSRAYQLKAEIKLKKGDGPQAAALFQQAIELPKSDKGEALFWRAKLRRELADAYDLGGKPTDAAQTRQAAIADWDTLIGYGLVPEALAEAGLEKAKLFYSQGDRDGALESLEKAIDAAPDRGATYADAIAFLIARGELDEALDAYHRALGRNEVTDYLKVYCSLWIVDLAKRAKQPEDPLATAYLQSTDGAKWYDDLARWATGRESETKLLERADTPARKAESSFYRGMRAFHDGKTDEARALWKQVLDTDMMAFFEYDMAAFYLKLGGAPAKPVAAGSKVRQ
jgi:tetratricopeptide (TPR) repeat protein